MRDEYKVIISDEGQPGLVSPVFTDCDDQQVPGAVGGLLGELRRRCALDLLSVSLRVLCTQASRRRPVVMILGSYDS